MDTDELKTQVKSEIPLLAMHLSKTDIHFLVQSLTEKDDAVRYNAFLYLQSNSHQFPFVYEYWSELEKKLESTNSYQRSLGIMLIAENVRWDKDGKFRNIISRYLSCCSDEKFITARQAIQGLAVALNTTDKYDNEIKQSLVHLPLLQYKENQQKILNKDISNILKIIEKRINSQNKSENS